MNNPTIIPSPCINVCVMQTVTEAASQQLAEPLCKGCARTIAEIAAWGGMSDEDKRLVWQQLPARQQKLGTSLPVTTGFARRGPV